MAQESRQRRPRRQVVHASRRQVGKARQLELNGEDAHQHETQPEDRHGQADEREAGGHVVQGRVLAVRRDDSERDPYQERQRVGRADQEDGVRESLSQHLQHGLLGDIGAAPVPGEAFERVSVLYVDRPVETVVLAQPQHVLGRYGGACAVGRHGIAGAERISAYPIIETSRSSSTLCATRATRNLANETSHGSWGGRSPPHALVGLPANLALQLPLPDVPVEVAPRVRLEVLQRALHRIDGGEVVQIDHRIVL